MRSDTVFTLLFVIATAVAIAVRRTRIPYTVALVLAGLGLGSLGWIQAPHLTKDLLFELILPGLIFEAAYHLKFEEFRRDEMRIVTLAIPGVIASMVVTAFLLSPSVGLLRGAQALQRDGALLFGALISATDPIAVVALCLASSLLPETATELANLAAGIVVAKVGTVPVEKHELLAALSPQMALDAEGRVLGREELVQRVALWKANGERVVFTNGCFDLLHIGHITLLEQARRCGDRLIVAINSDASVSCLKGPTRPIVSQRERARVLAALAAVDAVVIFDEPTPLELIVAVQPDVLVKGGDYRAESVVGAQEMKSWGGEVKIVPLVEGFSTTRLIEKGASQ